MIIRAEYVGRVIELFLRPTRHEVGHFGDLLSQSLDVLLKKLNLTQQKQTTHEQNSLS